MDFTAWPFKMFAPTGAMYFTCKVDIKDKKYRLTFSKLYIDFGDMERAPFKMEEEKVVEAFTGLSNDLKEFLKTAKKDDNW